MSHTLSTTDQYSHFRSILDAAFNAYTEKTGKDLPSQPLFAKLTTCDSADAITTMLRDQLLSSSQPGSSDDRLTKSLGPIVKVLNSFSSTIGAGIGLVYPPAGVIFTGIGVLLSAAQGVIDGQGALTELFERIGNFFRRLEIYTDVPSTAAMTDITVNMMIEVLSILAVATRELERGKARTYLNRLVGNTDIEEALLRLDKLTQEEALTVAVRVLKATQGVDDKVTAVGSGVRGIDDRVKGVERKVTRVLNIIQQRANDSDGHERNPLREDIREWLAPSDPSINYVTALEAHQEGTATWFIHGRTFADWKESGSLLWIRGNPGSGKSVLSSAIIQNIEGISNTGSAYIAYFFFDFKDIGKQDARALLSSLLIQLSDQSDSYFDLLVALYKAHRPRPELQPRNPATTALMQCFKEMLMIPEQVPIYLIMDALDECPDTSGVPSLRGKVLDVVKELVELQLPNLRLCVTSRPEADIRIALEPLSSVRISLHDESGQKQDIIDYISLVVNSDRKMKMWREDDRKLVITTLSARAGGMFRWVYCQLETLRHCLARNVQRTLGELPETLDDTYERILREIPSQNTGDTHRLLQCLAIAVRPLRVEELAEVLLVDVTTGRTPTLKVDSRWEDQEQAILLACSSLVAVVEDNDSRFVQFSHFSVKEFLTSDRFAASKGDVSHYVIRPGPAHMVMAQACLAVLLRLDYHVDKESIKSFPLADYAASHFGDHVEFGNVILRVRDAVDCLIDVEKPHFSAWLWVRGKIPSSTWRQVAKSQERLEVIPLYYMVDSGFLGMVQHVILKRPQDVNASPGHHDTEFMGRYVPTPLHLASEKGYLDIGRLLLDRGANVNAAKSKGKTPLHLAAKYGHVEFARMLLGRHARIRARDYLGQTPLHFAAKGGHCDMIQLILDHGGDVNVRDDNRSTPLHEALLRYDPEAAQLLLERGANVRVRNSKGMTPLYIASKRGYRDIIQLLLDRGVDVDVRNKKDSTPLHAALEGWKPEAAQLLIEGGANVHVRNNYDPTPLHLASQNGYLDVMRLILDQGVDVNAQDKDHSTALHLALQSRKPKATQLLLERGANVHIRNNDGLTPLHLASQNGYLDVMRLLLDQGVDVNAQDEYHSTALHLASQLREPKAAQLLLERGANVHVQNNDGRTPLHLASSKGYLDTMRLLLDQGVDVNVQDEHHSTALHRASQSWEPEAVQLLLERGANVHVQNNDGRTPLHLASSKGHLDTMRLLLDQGVDVNMQDEHHSTALHLASQSWDPEAVQLLLECGANVHVQNNDGRTPLHLASSKGHLDTMRLLLDQGVDVNAQDEHHSTALHLASQSWDPAAAQLLLECGAIVHARNNDGRIPLHLASSEGYLDIMRLLLDQGVDVNAQDEHHSTALHLASQSWDPEAAQLLLECGANVHARNNDGRIPLHLASSEGYLDIMRLLLDQGVDVNAQDEHHSTALHLASHIREPKAAQLLLERGANVHAQNNDGQTPLHLASEEGYLDVMSLLLDQGTDVNAKEKDHQTPLHVASWCGKLEAARLLLERGANVRALTKTGRNPYQYAETKEMKRLLSTHKRSRQKSGIYNSFLRLFK